MNILKIPNIDLIPQIAGSGVLDILNLNEENLSTIGWLDENGWPTSIFQNVIKELELISPTEFQYGAKFFDQVTDGFKIYNKFLEDGNNDE